MPSAGKPRCFSANFGVAASWQARQVFDTEDCSR
jgi:hypothetical protein